ncbi:hypothetical protein L6164_009524 [Bauhinia variegata]|uniref:Uncharacterized protein n=1 Tax=Bauhinia variegata TaxID=167791 RepID=A0ACB9PJ01_BAUVA|nr:hypothetical protein L6164_009524 [Bauhinia variegata]
MGWVWKGDEDDQRSSSASAGDIREPRNLNPRSGEQCSTRKIVKSQCKTEEVEPGRFVRKCEKTEEILRDCIGRPVEVVQSNKEYTEDDVTNEILKGPVTFGSSDRNVFGFPGLRSDIEALEKSLFGGLGLFIDAAEGLKNDFCDVFSKVPSIFDEQPSSSSSRRRGVPFEGNRGASPKPKEPEWIDADLSSLARDV